MSLNTLPSINTLQNNISKPAALTLPGYFLNQLRRFIRPRRVLLCLVFVIAAGLLALGKHYELDIRQAASALSTYIPSGINSAISGKVDGTRWDGDLKYEFKDETYPKKPTFHLLISMPDNTRSANLCKTLLSAAILNYPPPTLIYHEKADDKTQSGYEIVRNVHNFLVGKEVHDDDLVLIVGEESWFQLPAEVTISRFFRLTRDSNAKLLERYGLVSQENSAGFPLRSSPRYTQKVLFGAWKQCSNESGHPACYSVPQSPLPIHIYGRDTDRQAQSKHNRPQFMDSEMVFGRASDLRPIFKNVLNFLEFEDFGHHSTQYGFSRLFGKQEYQRSARYIASLSGIFLWKNWIYQKLNLRKDPAIRLAERNYEFGIGLDYSSSIFQTMDNSVEDIRFLKLDHPLIYPSHLRFSAGNPVQLPLDLNLTAPPFLQHKVSAPNPSPPMSALDNLPLANVPWTDINLLTNVIMPGGIVPAVVNFHGNEHFLDAMWEKMWFQKYARALLRQYIRSPEGPLAAQAAANGGDQWWDLRGGKGGVWTGRGEWFEWNEVCGDFDDEVFRDGKGMFGYESAEDGGEQPVYNGFGQIVSGKERPVKFLQVEEDEVDDEDWYEEEMVEVGVEENEEKITPDKESDGKAEMVEEDDGKSET
ncbi:hypothetical protein G7Y89_g12693 [Cudoniella acicularis]|uniref:Uncharacterized protein n=1 Tax=Cudoniella acicularis TaxID=354080 RepID=A0A8H4RBC7_9HELO|nr:hypothetical protein G7Y89_g12693 [Cudoniella acicularis]